MNRRGSRFRGFFPRWHLQCLVSCSHRIESWILFKNKKIIFFSLSSFSSFSLFRLGHVWYLGTYLFRSPLGIYWLWLWKLRNALTLIDNLHTMHVNIEASTSGYYLPVFCLVLFPHPRIFLYCFLFIYTYLLFWDGYKFKQFPLPISLQDREKTTLFLFIQSKLYIIYKILFPRYNL